MALQAAIEGQGIALGTTAIVADDLASGRLVLPFDLHLTTNFAYSLVWPKTLAGKPMVAGFHDWISAAINQ